MFKKKNMLVFLSVMLSLFGLIDAKSSSCASSCAQFEAAARCCLGRSQFVDNNGVQIAYTVSGNCKGRPIVFIHGLPLNGQEFICQCKHLSSCFQIITVDLRGFGNSDQSPTLPMSYANWVSDVNAVINALGLRNPIIVGFSFGSIVAELYAATNSNISKLILLSPYDGQLVNTPNALCPTCPAYSNGVPLEALVALLALLPNRTVFDQTTADLFVPETCSAAAKVRAYAVCLTSKTATDSINNIAGSGVFLTGVTSVLPSISVPTLILSGAGDPLMNPNGLCALNQAIPNSRAMEFPGGHLFNITQSREVDRAIYKFITEDPACCDVCF